MTKKEKEIIERIEKFAQNKLLKDKSGHDWFHTWRVVGLAKKIQKKEGGNLFIIEVASLLHDVFDWKFVEEENIERDANKFLNQFSIEKEYKENILHIIKYISFKGAKVKNKMESFEGKIVQDADKLDALGAVGIARAFTFGGHFNMIMHSPDKKPTLHERARDYKNKRSSTINHFYEKLLLLKQMLHTKTAKEIAKSRHRYVQEFLKRFLAEWDGKI